MAKSGMHETLLPVYLKNIKYDGPVYKICTIGDGSCFFHALLRAFYSPYIQATSPQERSQSAHRLRLTLAGDLAKVNPQTGKRLYDTLGGGFYEEFSKAVPEYSLDAMVADLRSNNPVDTAYQELCATVFNCDIYIIDSQKGDVYPTAEYKNSLYKGRPSMFVYGSPGHYEILAIPMKVSGVYACYLVADHPFTLAVSNRLKELAKLTPPPVAATSASSDTTDPHMKITNAPGPIIDQSSTSSTQRQVPTPPTVVMEEVKISQVSVSAPIVNADHQSITLSTT